MRREKRKKKWIHDVNTSIKEFADDKYFFSFGILVKTHKMVVNNMISRLTTIKDIWQSQR